MPDDNVWIKILKRIAAIPRHEVMARMIILRQNVEPDVFQIVNRCQTSTPYFRDQQRCVVSADRGACKNVRQERRVIGRGRISGKESLKYAYFVSAPGANTRS